MNTGRADATGPWTWLSSGVGYHLDNFGDWLLRRSPSLGRIYASLLKPPPPSLEPRPGWKFGEEYYEQRLWLTCRRGALWETARRSGRTIPLIVRWHAKTAVEVTLGNDNSLCLYVCGSFEPNEFALLDRILKPGMVFVDVGANDGYFSIFAAKRVGTQGRVLAFEPSSRERAHLFRNLRLNGITNVTVLPLALGNSEGVVELKLADGLHTGHNTLGKFVHEDVHPWFSEDVEIRTLDSLCENLKVDRVDVIKIDVEGGEAGVTAGARHTLAKFQPILLLELNDRGLRAQGQSASELLRTLRVDLDYEILSFVSAKRSRAAEPVDHGELSPNIVAVPRGRAQELLAQCSPLVTSLGDNSLRSAN
jgi:FkbM family methyltransferase